jgi:hypothetical protein
MKIRTSLPFLSLLVFALIACGKKKQPVPSESANMAKIETALDSFANALKTTPPTTADLGGRIYSYLQAHSTIFYGSTVTLLDTNGKATYSPYYFRKNGFIDSASLMAPSYKIDSQGWLRQPIDSGFAVWTAPYFDAGGGEIWMRTRSVPVFIGGKVFAIATTDLPVNQP